MIPLFESLLALLLGQSPGIQPDILYGQDAFFTIAATGNPDAAKGPEPAPARPSLAQGVLLIAGKNLLDPFFEQTVVLITEYGDGGSAGLVLNRRVKSLPAHALPQLGDLAGHLDAMYLGGPVATNHLRLLVKSDTPPAGARMIVDNVFLIDTREALQQLDPGHMRADNMRLFMGFAGWAPGQLETELLRGDWHIWPASSKIIFSMTPENIWYALIYLATAKWI